VRGGEGEAKERRTQMGSQEEGKEGRKQKEGACLLAVGNMILAVDQGRRVRERVGIGTCTK